MAPDNVLDEVANPSQDVVVHFPARYQRETQCIDEPAIPLQDILLDRETGHAGNVLQLDCNSVQSARHSCKAGDVTGVTTIFLAI